MNLEAALIARIEKTRETRKDACKNYATKEAAEKATAIAAQRVANEFALDRSKDAVPARYIVVFVASWGRWVGGIDMQEVIGRSTSTGGYLGIEPGFYKF